MSDLAEADHGKQGAPHPWTCPDLNGQRTLLSASDKKGTGLYTCQHLGRQTT